MPVNPSWPKEDSLYTSTKERRGKNFSAKIVHTVVLLKTKYYIMFVQKMESEAGWGFH